MMKIALAVLVGASAPAHAADQASDKFDLVCSNSEGEHRLRIDLKANEWCEGACSRVQKIAKTTSGMIVLENTLPAFPGDTMSVSEVNRVTGEFLQRYRVTGQLRANTRQCSKSTFSGFPAIKF